MFARAVFQRRTPESKYIHWDGSAIDRWPSGRCTPPAPHKGGGVERGEASGGWGGVGGHVSSPAHPPFMGG